MDTGVFVVLPDDGAALLRRMVDGADADAAADWYQDQYGETVDVHDFLTDLAELGFVMDGEQPAPSAQEDVPVRWQRLGRALFSRATAVLFGCLIAAWAAVVAFDHSLAPTYHRLFFTQYVSVITVVLLAAQTPLVLLHEAAHALAGRRLGLPSRLSVGRRFHYLVFLTTMDGLVAVPRRKRYLPILAGMLTDVAVLAALTLCAAALRGAGGTGSAVASAALALAYLTGLRLLWQGWFFLQTDVYYLVTTVLGCVDLHTTARQLNANRWRAWTGRAPAHDPDRWHPRDRAVARWYAVLMIVGYGVSLTTFAFAILPGTVHLLRMVFSRFTAGSADAPQIADSCVFLLLIVGQVAFAVWLSVRQRRARPSAAPVSAS
ncbi:hypothetical protein V2S66_21425 [Streptomyces sp. V4-01]|uniref:Uncharacterized protein n=1 Tax=Actinacidiphila polyblastidii TaxID=3110430 RepID=A0ABU7PH04_9ACTN|nr:hypothetical protein [Streptomyces sp. V4-01]